MVYITTENGHKVIVNGKQRKYLALEVINNMHVYPLGYKKIDPRNFDELKNVKFKDGDTLNCIATNLFYRFKSPYKGISWNGVDWVSHFAFNNKVHYVTRGDNIERLRIILNEISMHFKGKPYTIVKNNDNPDKYEKVIERIVQRIQSRI